MDHLLFNGWQPLIRITIVGAVSYVALILMLRLGGKRTLSRMTAYDMIITMALGSLLTKAMLTAEQSISESLLAIVLLVGFQYVVSVASCHSPWFAHLVAGRPSLMFHDGVYRSEAMQKERVTRVEIDAAIEQKGIADIAMVGAVILGSNGELNVTLKPEAMNGAMAMAASSRQGKV